MDEAIGMIDALVETVTMMRAQLGVLTAGKAPSPAAANDPLLALWGADDQAALKKWMEAQHTIDPRLVLDQARDFKARVEAADEEKAAKAKARKSAAKRPVNDDDDDDDDAGDADDDNDDDDDDDADEADDADDADVAKPKTKQQPAQQQQEQQAQEQQQQQQAQQQQAQQQQADDSAPDAASDDADEEAVVLPQLASAKGASGARTSRLGVGLAFVGAAMALIVPTIAYRRRMRDVASDAYASVVDARVRERDASSESMLSAAERLARV
jgi:hypothetical protein